MALKPKVLIDIKSGGYDSYHPRCRRLNLGAERGFNGRLIDVFKIVAVVSVAAYLVVGSVLAPISPHSFAAQDLEVERRALEEELAELERQIDQQEITIAEYQSQRRTLQREIDTLDAQIRKLSLQVKASTVSINRLGEEISQNEGKVVDAEKRLDNSRSALTKLLQQLYEQDRTTLVGILLRGRDLSDFFGNVSNLLEVQNGVSVAVAKMAELRNELLAEKEQLAIRLGDVEALKRYQAAQKEAVEETKNKKGTLLSQTKGEEAKYQALLEKTKQNAAKIRSRLFTFLGGGEMDFGTAYKFAKFAEDATGVDAALILAVLDRESALGSNVGKCRYDENPYYPARASNPKTMKDRDIEHFLRIVGELGLSPSIPVSCPIPRDGAYGGAMGPAQFIPSTWALYENKLRQLTGDTPSPWNNGHAILATALYLKDAINSRTCQNYINENDHILPAETLRYRCAGGVYYAGLGNWYRYRLTYGDAVAQKARGFADDILVLRNS